MLKDKIDDFLRVLRRSDNTKKQYRSALRKFYSVVGDAELTVEVYEKFLPHLSNYSPSTQGVYKAAIVGLYRHNKAGDPAQMSYIAQTYTEAAKFKPVVFEYEEVNKLIKHADNLRKNALELRDRAFIISLCDTGLRISELVGLRRGDINWNEQYAMVTGKGRKTAKVRFSGRSLQALNDYLTCPERAKMDGGSGKALNSLPLLAQHGNIKKTKRMTRGGMWRSFKKRCGEIGVNLHPHELRHYFVTTVILASGGNMKMAQDFARHGSVSVTQRYAHMAESELDQAYDEIFNSPL